MMTDWPLGPLEFDGTSCGNRSKSTAWSGIKMTNDARVGVIGRGDEASGEILGNGPAGDHRGWLRELKAWAITGVAGRRFSTKIFALAFAR